MGALRLTKRVFNRSLDLFFQIPALDDFWFSRSKGTAICLCYHRVDNPSNHAFLTQGGVPAIEPAALERDLSFLQKKGARFLTFDDLRAGKLSASDVHVIVTFDDCYVDNYTHGLAVLGRLGIPAVFFQTTSMIDSHRL